MKKNGFTLIELSIVLVIIGLMVGAVVGGRALVKQATFQKLIKQIYGYETVINAYKLQYNALPGDHKEATQYWPGKTEDGNGDGMIWDNWNPSDVTAYYEHVKMWQHLVLAELVNFAYFTSYTPMVIGGNIPKSAFDGVGYRVQNFRDGQEDVIYGRKDSNGFLAAAMTPGAADTWKSFLTPANAKNIDSKMDDGIPTTGKLFGLVEDGSSGSCVSGSADNEDPGNEVYDVGNTGIACMVIYWLD